MLTIADVAKLLGPSIKPKTISTYMSESKRGGRYEKHPFPEPDGRIGRAPWWLPSRADAIRKWDVERPGQGAGGGRPRRK